MGDMNNAEVINNAYSKLETNMKKTKRLWDNYIEVAEVQKTTSTKLIVAAGVRDGVRYINIREFYYSKKFDKWLPSRFGIAVPLAIPINKGTEVLVVFKPFFEAVLKAAKVVKDMELSDPEASRYLDYTDDTLKKKEV